jgi:phosphohistidine phosphatase
MRHAKSSWKDKHIEDYDRPLNKRGRGDAPFMGFLLKKVKLVPQKILCSSATRARQTAEGVMQGCDFNGEVTFFDSFYLAGPGAYYEELASLPEHLEIVMIIGHNPGLAGLLQLLTGGVESLPTAAVAHLSLPVETWSDLPECVTGELIEVWQPRKVIN